MKSKRVIPPHAYAGNRPPGQFTRFEEYCQGKEVIKIIGIRADGARVVIPVADYWLEPAEWGTEEKSG